MGEYFVFMKMHKPNVRIDHQYLFLFNLYESGKFLLKKTIYTPQKLCGVYILDNGQVILVQYATKPNRIGSNETIKLW